MNNTQDHLDRFRQPPAYAHFSMTTIPYQEPRRIAQPDIVTNLNKGANLAGGFQMP